jgi:predicted RNA-binding Zn ribbon-like protein
MHALFGSPPPSAIPHDWGTAPCLDLINSRWNDHLGGGRSFDRLPVPKFRRAFLKRWRFEVDDPDNRKAVADLARLRGVLRIILERYASGRPVTLAMRTHLETEMNRAPMELKIEGARAGMRLQHRRSGRGWEVVMAEIATSAARLMSEGWTVKVCANPNCSWMFVDESRPHTRRWCNTGVCGSLVNVRRYRMAHAADQRRGAR